MTQTQTQMRKRRISADGDGHHKVRRGQEEEDDGDCSSGLHACMLAAMQRRLEMFVESRPAADHLAEVRRRLDLSAPHEFPDLSDPVGRLLRDAASQSADLLQIDLRPQAVVECLRHVRRDREHAHHAACIFLAVASEWRDVNWGGLYVAITDASARETGAWRPVAAAMADGTMTLTDLYVLALSVVSKMGRCEADEMPQVDDPRGPFLMRRPVMPNLPSCCIWRTGMHHCARAAHICSAFGRSGACDLERVLGHAFAERFEPGACGSSDGSRSEEAIGRELRRSMDAVRVVDVVSDMIMLQGWLFTADGYAQISAAVGSLLWPDFSKYVLLANAMHNCTMTFVPVSGADAFTVVQQPVSVSAACAKWYVQPSCRLWMRAALIGVLLEQMAADACAVRTRVHVRGVLDRDLLAAWALTSPEPFIDGGLRQLLAGDAVKLELAPTEACGDIATFRVHVVVVLGLQWRVPELLPTTDRASPAFAADLETFLRRFRPGALVE